jgi:hypothetical protein
MMIPARLAFQSVIKGLKNKLSCFKMMPDILLFKVDMRNIGITEF